MENTNAISKERLEYLKLYLTVFAKAFRFVTSKKLETLDQLIDAIQKDKITFDDVFGEFVERCFKTNFGTDDEERFWDDNMKMFDRENYFPDNNKQLGEGAWIKIRTENGFEIHYAKKANRKRRYEEEYQALSKKIMKLYKKDIVDLEDTELNVQKMEEILSPANEIKKEKLKQQHLELGVRIILNSLPVYEVKIMRTKSVAEYYLPYQYEIVDNIEEFSDAYINSVPGVKIKSLYTSQNKDAIFYLQSRGIRKEVAQMMAALKQTYFTVNMEVAITEYGKIFNKQVKEALSA